MKIILIGGAHDQSTILAMKATEMQFAQEERRMDITFTKDELFLETMFRKGNESYEQANSDFNLKNRKGRFLDPRNNGYRNNKRKK